MQKLIKILMKSIKYALLFIAISIFISFVWHFIPPLSTYDYAQCSNKYSLKKIYENLNKTHTWKIYDEPFQEIESSLDGTRDGILVDVNVDKITKEISSNITHVKNNKWDGYALGYLNGELSSIYYYRNGLKEGLYFTFTDKYPSMLVVYKNDKNVGLLGFWDYGRIRGVKFGSHYNNEAREGGKDNSVYDNGQKAFEHLEENGTKYWVVYNPKGQMLVKYPTDNDFCKAEFYEDGKKVEIPYYFDQKEFGEIYEKIKSDVNKSVK